MPLNNTIGGESTALRLPADGAVTINDLAYGAGNFKTNGAAQAAALVCVHCVITGSSPLKNR